MLNPEDKEKLQNMIRSNWYIFSAYTGAVVLYTVVVFVVIGNGSSEPLQVGVLKPLFIIVSVVLGAIKFLIQGRLWLKENAYRKCRTLDEIMARYGRYYFIILALCQVVPLFGLIIVFMTKRMEDWWLFFGITVVLFATSAPRAGKVESIVQAHATRVP